MASTPKKSAMKKDSSEKRASSARRQSSATHKSGGSGTISNNAAISKAKQQIEEMTKENTALQQEANTLKTQNRNLNETLEALSSKIIEDARAKGFHLGKEDEHKTCLEVPLTSLQLLLNSLAYSQEVIKKKKKGSVEARVEELETRITHLNMELAKLLQLRLTLEHGLEDILEKDSIDSIKEKARFLLFEAEGSELSTFVEPEEPDSDSDKDSSVVKETGILPEKYSVQTIIKNLDTFQLNPPLVKLPGDTHIKRMDEKLKKYIICELSLYKGNGADWRLVADRVGISTDTVQQWRRWKVEYPMQYVMESWGQSVAATVRMLHRHLVSPQMKSILLAKRVSDFYQVD